MHVQNIDNNLHELRVVYSFGEEQKTDSKGYGEGTGLTSHRRQACCKALLCAWTHFRRCKKEEFLWQKFFQKDFRKENLEGRHVQPSVGCWHASPQNTSSNCKFFKDGARLVFIYPFCDLSLPVKMHGSEEKSFLSFQDLTCLLKPLCGNCLRASCLVRKYIIYQLCICHLSISLVFFSSSENRSSEHNLYRLVTHIFQVQGNTVFRYNTNFLALHHSFSALPSLPHPLWEGYPPREITFEMRQSFCNDISALFSSLFFLHTLISFWQQPHF